MKATFEDVFGMYDLSRVSKGELRSAWSRVKDARAINVMCYEIIRRELVRRGLRVKVRKSGQISGQWYDV